jgi:phospholipase A1
VTAATIPACSNIKEHRMTQPTHGRTTWLQAGTAMAIAMALGDLACADAMQTCLLRKLDSGSGDATAREMRAACLAEIGSSAAPITTEKISAARERVQRERSTQWSPYVLSAHRQNYILVYSHVDEQNPIYITSGDRELAEKKEVKFQVSFKFPLTQDDLFVHGDAVHLGFTLKSFWQLYNDDISAPFRETNYNPELFYTMPLQLGLNGADTALRFGFEHESNGRTQLLSRSWNRIYAQVFYAKDNYFISVRPWYRIPEDDKDSPTDADGDDNPDIDDYMGYFDLTGALTYRSFEFTTLIRNNLRSDNRGAVELGVSFPLWGRLRGFAQYFIGYGESLIDYNHNMERIGVGVLLTDLL